MNIDKIKHDKKDNTFETPEDFRSTIEKCKKIDIEVGKLKILIKEMTEKKFALMNESLSLFEEMIKREALRLGLKNINF